MLLLLFIIFTLLIFAVLIVLAGIRGFFKGAGEEFKRQHGVLSRFFRKMKAHHLWRSHKKKKGLPKEGAQDVDSEPTR
ncbi:MAG: hypothetical protein J5639_07455 [Bacteroidales bacterium]|nr:hypothetical protein [Bacteroidales bacterium]